MQTKSRKITKKIISMILMVMMIFSVCIPASAQAQEAAVAANVTEVAVGETTKLSVYGWNLMVTWTSSDEDVATVNGWGTVTGVSVGEATISAKALSIFGITTTTEFTVSVTPVNADATIEVGETLEITVDGNETTTWTTSDEAIATVENGTVTGVGEGVATITAKTTKRTGFFWLFFWGKKTTVVETFVVEVVDPESEDPLPPVIEEIDASTSENILTESEAIEFLAGKGFVDFPVMYEYSIDGTYNEETDADSDSDTKHPAYQTYYISANDELWTIHIIDGEIYANPVSFNVVSDLGVLLLVSASEILCSYDYETNKFYLSEPIDSELKMIKVDGIDAETLDNLTIEELCTISGATPPIAEDSTETVMQTTYANSNTEVVTVDAAGPRDEDPFIIVSLGDSFSAGEGIEKFYGQDKELEEKVEDEDWLAHRSQRSWPSLLQRSEDWSDDKTMADYKVKLGSASTKDIQWYFAAASGATTKHINNRQAKPYYQEGEGVWDDLFNDVKDANASLPPQINVFTDDIKGKVDYVTLTLGGNDVNFTGVISKAAMNSADVHLFQKKSSLEKELDKQWKKVDGVLNKLEDVYNDIVDAAGPQVTIIVAGYPKLLPQDGDGARRAWFSKKEAKLVNEKITEFNNKIENLINSLRNSGQMDIWFVDVETEFDKDGGHQAYTEQAWLNGIIMPAKKQDLINDKSVLHDLDFNTEIIDSAVDLTIDLAVSSYSMHPNANGAKAYARCVNAMIWELEEMKKQGTLSGKVCKASDRITAIPGAMIEVGNDEWGICDLSDTNGNYNLSVPRGKYLVTISSEGYLDFKAYATVEEGEVLYMETFLMIEGSADTIGMASGKVINSLTGIGAQNVTLTIKPDWNNINETTDVVKTITTDSNGYYSVELPLGNYTVIATKEGYTSSYFNIIVQEGTTGNQNGTITPVVSEGEGNNYLITLTWGENPRDLDSHMVGESNGSQQFHVYFGNKTYGDECALDYDDTSSYGPEHITLVADEDDTYYYYIYHFSGSGAIITSEAKITVEQGNTLIAVFNVPTDLSTERYWNVFAIKDGKLIISNTITASADTSYAD